jgi:hypothetical protein
MLIIKTLDVNTPFNLASYRVPYDHKPLITPFSIGNGYSAGPLDDSLFAMLIVIALIDWVVMLRWRSERSCIHTETQGQSGVYLIRGFNINSYARYHSIFIN